MDKRIIVNCRDLHRTWMDVLAAQACVVGRPYVLGLRQVADRLAKLQFDIWSLPGEQCGSCSKESKSKLQICPK